MRYSQAEKMEVIRIVEDSELGITRTLKELQIHKSTFYSWYKRYLEDGYPGLKISTLPIECSGTRSQRRSEAKCWIWPWSNPNVRREKWRVFIPIPVGISYPNPACIKY